MNSFFSTTPNFFCLARRTSSEVFETPNFSRRCWWISLSGIPNFSLRAARTASGYKSLYNTNYTTDSAGTLMVIFVEGACLVCSLINFWRRASRSKGTKNLAARASRRSNSASISKLSVSVSVGTASVTCSVSTGFSGAASITCSTSAGAGTTSSSLIGAFSSTGMVSSTTGCSSGTASN